MFLIRLLHLREVGIRKTYEKARLGFNVLLTRNLWIQDVPGKILECLYFQHKRKLVESNFISSDLHSTSNQVYSTEES